MTLSLTGLSFLLNIVIFWEGDMMDFAQEEKILKKLFNVDMYKDIKDNDINVNEIMEQMEDIIEAGQALEVGFDNILNK